MSKPSFYTCPSGHYYATSLKECPYCSEGNTKTAVPLNNNKDSDKTELMSDGGKTETYSAKVSDQNTVNLGNQGNSGSSSDDRTMIRVPSKDNDNSQIHSSQEQARNSRKLVGWLVSFTIDEMGLDYRLFEGQNKVGRDPSCNIRIIQDGSMSSHHATILFRNGFYLRDEMATNSSYVNGSELLPGSTIEIKDGDKIKLGSNEFLLKTAY